MPPFDMPIDEVYPLRADRTVVVVGKVATGEVRPGASLVVCTPTGRIPVTVRELVGFSPIHSALAGENAAVCVVGISSSQVVAGSRLTGAV